MEGAEQVPTEKDISIKGNILQNSTQLIHKSSF